MRIKVHCEVRPYEVEGKDAPFDVAPFVVDSHWNRDDMVVLKYGGVSITVLARDLQNAITNATRTE